MTPTRGYCGASLEAQMVKNHPAKQETQVWSLSQEDPWRKGWLPTPIFLPGEFHGQRSLAGYSPWCCKVNMTERLSLSFIRSKATIDHSFLQIPASSFPLSPLSTPLPSTLPPLPIYTYVYTYTYIYMCIYTHTCVCVSYKGNLFVEKNYSKVYILIISFKIFCSKHISSLTHNNMLVLINGRGGINHAFTLI